MLNAMLDDVEDSGEELEGEEDDDGVIDEEEQVSDGLMYTPDAAYIQHTHRIANRVTNPELPDTVQVLTTRDGCTVYLVGTAHFSEKSQQDVARTVQQTQPDVVLVELCSSRINILSLDEETLLKEAKSINMDKIRLAIRQSGFVQGILHLLLLSMTAHITKQLGMAPGGEFRTAFNEARKVPGCRIHLGDRPIAVTLQRALGSLSWYQKMHLAWYMLTSKDSISQEEVEKCKQKDLLEEMLREMTGEFPALSRVFVTERDVFLSNSLKLAAKLLNNPHSSNGFIPSVVVGIVGIGHVPGIISNWDQDHDVSSLLLVPTTSRTSICFKWAMKASLAGVLLCGCYHAFKFFARSFPSLSVALPVR